MKLLIENKIQIGFIAALVFLLLTGVITWWSAQRNAEAFRSVDQSYEVLDKLEETLVGVLNTETETRGFAVSGDEAFLQTQQAEFALLQKSLATVKRITQDSPNQQRRLAALDPLIQNEISSANEMNKLRRSGDAVRTQQLIAFGQERQTMDEIRRLVTEAEAEEKQLLHQGAAKAQKQSATAMATAALGGLLSLGFVGVASVTVQRDFKKRRQAEEARRLSESRYHALFNSIDEGFCIIEMIFDEQEKPVDYRFLEINPSFEKQTGLRDARGKRMRELAPQHEAHWFEIYGRIAMTGEAARFQNRAEQLQRSYDVYAFRFGEPKNRQVAILFNDITERKRADEEIHGFNLRLEELVAQRTAQVQQALATLDAIDDGAFIFDPETLRNSYVNEGAVRQLGYTREELLRMTGLIFKPEFNETRYREMLAPMLRGEVCSHRFITKHRHKDGHEILVEINLQYVAPIGDRPRFITIARDITERKKAEQLAYRSQRLESIGTLASGVAHDLNNILAPIMMGVELIRMEYPGKSTIVDLFETSAKRGADTVRQLLSFAKGADSERVSFQPSHLIDELSNLITVSFPKNIQLVVKCDPKLPTVLGDATQLHQVLLNLCVNARDAMPNGGTLTLEAGSQEVDNAYAGFVPGAKPGKYVKLCVRDTGTGIPPEIIDRIFDPFFTTKGPDIGTGLGLSTVMGIVKGHGGFLQVYSKPTQGSTFTAYLPVELTGNDNELITKTALEFCGQGEVILLVDDEAAVRAMGRLVLRQLNFKPLIATDGDDGLIQAAQHRTELRAIITDLHMPRMNGLAFVRTLRKLLPDIPVVVTSGRMDDAEAEELKTLAATSRLDKPFTEAQLAEALKNLLTPK